MKRCWFFHKWTRWDFIEVDVKMAWEKEYHPAVRQIRECERCGRRQISNLH